MDANAPYVRLAGALDALASPTRLALVAALRTPKLLSQIEVRPPERPESGSISRQVVTKHLDRLIASGLVSTRDVVRDSRDAVEFLVNHQTIYALSDDVRAFARLRPAVEPPGRTADGRLAEGRPASGPGLVVVKGVEEGAFFPLAAPKAGAEEWLIGRRRDVAVPLDFDPFVSSVNSRITLEDGAHAIEDLDESRNGTLVNFQPLARGRRRALHHGDVVGVGRSLLVYWA